MIPKLRHSACVFGKILETEIFYQKEEWAFEDLWNKLYGTEMILISKQEAFKLSKYLFGLSMTESTLELGKIAKSDFIHFRFETLIGEYIPCSEDIID